jgi:hypothetical protein
MQHSKVQITHSTALTSLVCAFECVHCSFESVQGELLGRLDDSVKASGFSAEEDIKLLQ